MSISIQNITKLYDTQKALDQVSFEVNKGEILGFLGPNGAGKSTLMKIITCFIQPTSGTVKVNGVDVQEDPLQVREMLGYLPEHNPLYYEMYVKEYLEFVAGIHKLSNKKQAVDKVIELVGLELEMKKRIGALSKGYKQKVGIAAAICHNPKLLVLDEPLVGLDPNAIIQIKEVIKDLSKDHTIFISSHQLSDLASICDDIAILNEGHIIAHGPIDEIEKTLEIKQEVEVEFENIDIAGFSLALLFGDEQDDFLEEVAQLFGAAFGIIFLVLAFIFFIKPFTFVF